jgi:hypothetical protein
MRSEPEVSDLRRLDSGEDARGVTRNQGVGAWPLRLILDLLDDAGEVEGGEIILRFLNSDERKGRQRHATFLKCRRGWIGDIPASTSSAAAVIARWKSERRPSLRS